ncbi:hypothetical protein D3C81_1182900 [compost metagenome]
MGLAIVSSHIRHQGAIRTIPLSSRDVERRLAGGQQQRHQPIDECRLARTVVTGNEGALGVNLRGMEAMEGSPVVYRQLG